MDQGTGTDKWWWEPPEGSLPFEFCRDTSLHGLKYIYQPQRHLTERIFWLLAFLIGLSVAVFMISGVWKTYREKPIIVAFEPFETTVDTIPFPAVTICNMNKVQKKHANSILSTLDKMQTSTPEYMNAQQQVYYLHHVCNVSSGFSKTFNFSLPKGAVDDKYFTGPKNLANQEEENQLDVEQFLRKASQRCPEMIPLCIWQDEIQNCTVLFNPIETDFGKCCTFNMVSQTLLNRFLNDSRDDPNEVKEWRKWKLTDGLIFQTDAMRNLTFPRRQTRAGKTFGLSILLDPDLDEYFCTTSDSEGFRLTTHLSVDVPHVADFGIAVSPNSEIFVNIRPEITVAEDSIRDFPLDKRLCYFPGEYPLQYYEYYTPSNCVEECIANKTFEECGCVRYYMPRDDQRELCGPEKFTCAETVKKKYLLEGLSKSCDLCYRTCQEIQYMMETTSTKMDAADDNWMFQNQSFAKWRYNNVSIVHIFLGQTSTYARIRKQLYGGTELMAQTGGVMGLCLGFSGLSLVEVLYYFIIRPWWQRRRERSRMFEQSGSADFRRTENSGWIGGRNMGTVQESSKTLGKLGNGLFRGMQSTIYHHSNYSPYFASSVREEVYNSNGPDVSHKSSGQGVLLSNEIAPFYKSYHRNKEGLIVPALERYSN